MTAVVRLSNEDESGDPITPDSQTGADADRGGNAARADDMQSESRPSGITQASPGRPSDGRMDEARAISKQQIGPDFGSERRRRVGAEL